MQPLAVVSKAHELPFSFNLGMTAQQESGESPHVLDDAKQRLDRLFVHSVRRAPALGIELVLHRLAQALSARGAAPGALGGRKS